MGRSDTCAKYPDAVHARNRLVPALALLTLWGCTADTRHVAVETVTETKTVTVTAPRPVPLGEPEVEDEDDVRLEVGTMAVRGSPADAELIQIGSVPVIATASTLDGGVVEVGGGPDGGNALRMPNFADGAEYPRAVVAVTAQETDPDPLAPGGRDFLFGADFRLDATSVGAPVDDGDNILQRGLASDSSQFKLEIGGGRPRCRIAGSEGEVNVVMPGVPLEPERWYHVECARSDDLVTLSVAAYQPDGALGTPMVSTQEGTTGELVWSQVQTPLAVGGKLAANGHVIRSATDQFNGSLANPVLRIEGP